MSMPIVADGDGYVLLNIIYFKQYLWYHFESQLFIA